MPKQKPQSLCHLVEVIFHFFCPVLVIKASHEVQPLSRGGDYTGGGDPWGPAPKVATMSLLTSRFAYEPGSGSLLVEHTGAEAPF